MSVELPAIPMSAIAFAYERKSSSNYVNTIHMYRINIHNTQRKQVTVRGNLHVYNIIMYDMYYRIVGNYHFRNQEVN